MGSGYVRWCLSVQQGHFPCRSKFACPYISRLRYLILQFLLFEGAAAVGQPGGDGLLVAADAAGEGVKCGLVAGLDGGEPVLQCEQALAAGHHDGEAAHVTGGGGQRGAGADSRARFAASSPARWSGWVMIQRGDLAGLGGCGCGRCGELGLGAGLAVSAVGGAELAQVAPRRSGCRLSSRGPGSPRAGGSSEMAPLFSGGSKPARERLMFDVIEVDSYLHRHGYLHVSRTRAASAGSA